MYGEYLYIANQYTVREFFLLPYDPFCLPPML